MCWRCSWCMQLKLDQVALDRWIWSKLNQMWCKRFEPYGHVAMHIGCGVPWKARTLKKIKF
jgi:hypothetical protein